jgi:hypothetical protein
MNPIEIAQHLLSGPWMHADAALRACQRGEWARFIQETAPAKPKGFFATGKRDHGRCMELATRPPTGPVMTTLTLVPLWTCSTEDFESDEWRAVHGVVQEGQLIDVLRWGTSVDTEEAPSGLDTLSDCTVRRWTASMVVLSRNYAPDLSLQLRAGEFAVMETHFDEVVSVEARPAQPLPRPTRWVPMFASWLEPRVEVPPELAARIQARCFTAESLPDEEP